MVRILDIELTSNSVKQVVNRKKKSYSELITLAQFP